jgi:putative intracellular protease/amidase
MEIAILVFDRMTALDAIGPYEVLARLPEARIRFVGKKRGLVTTDTGFLRLDAEAALDEVPRPDVLLVPGGFGTRRLMTDPDVLAWVKSAHETTQWTTSVCTGALVLGAAGLLRGLEATTYWAVLDMLAPLGAIPVRRRWVEQGKIVTAAGVSAGIDMALALAARIAGDEVAQRIQLGIEYDPHPPFSSGSVETASPAIVESMRAQLVAAAAAG